MGKILLLFCLAMTGLVKAQTKAPEPVLPVPSAAQVEWQRMETYAFIHFGPNTFLDQEWGYGDADPAVFNPSRLDCDQWVRILKQAGMKGVIFTAKHHDGFCLWPTRLTEYNISRSPYKQGKGDLVGELADACRRHGLKLGLYLSPWDRHQATYGTAAYTELYHRQWEELLTHYGPLFEVWFDGANGGDGYYGGARETRRIDGRTYYDLPEAFAQVGRLQPYAIIFSDGGPGCRWVGNERGHADATNWSLLRAGELYPGTPHTETLPTGHANGNQWTAAECDVSVRPGWFYHEREDSLVKSPQQLADIFYRSVGHNATFLLNVPVDKEGRIHPADSTAIVGFHELITSELSDNLLCHARIKASSTRGRTFSVKALTDNDFHTYWATPDGITDGTLLITFRHPTLLNRLRLQEYIPLGQRVQSFSVEFWDGHQWQSLPCDEPTTTIGYTRLLRFPAIRTKHLRIRLLQARGPLCINEIGAYLAK